MVHQNKKTNFGSSFYLSKTEGLGMASIREANCMELRLVRVWHQAVACISPSPFGLDSIQCSALIPYSPLARFHTATGCGFHPMLRIDLVRENGNGKFYWSKAQALLFLFSEATPTCIKTSTRLGAIFELDTVLWLFLHKTNDKIILNEALCRKRIADP